MALDYTRLQLVAQRLIEENGRPVTFVKLGRVPDDPTRPWEGAASVRNPDHATNPATEVANVKVVFADTISSRYLGQLMQQQDNLKANQRFIMVATLSLPCPADEYDEIRDANGRIYIIERGNELQPGPLEMFQALTVTERELYSK